MKRFRDRYHNYMIKPMIYLCITKLSVSFAFCILWAARINTNSVLHMTDYAFPIVGVVFLACSWFQYLSLDGIHIISYRKKKPRKHSFLLKTMVDHTEEDVISFEELEPEERTACRLASNVITGMVFLLISIIAALIGS